MSTTKSRTKYEWERSLPEKNIKFKFVDDGSKNFFPSEAAIKANRSKYQLMGFEDDADLLERHGATFPYCDEEFLDVYQKKYRSVFNYQNIGPMLHFLKMIELGEEEEKRGERIYKEQQLHEEMSSLDIQDEESHMEIKRTFYKMKKQAILRNETNIWNRCLEILHPSCAAEIFNSQGVNLVCVTSLKSIYEIERASSEHFTEFENVILSDHQIELIEFMKEICLDDNKDDKHFLTRLCSGIYKNGAYTTRWKEILPKYKKKDVNTLVTRMVSHLQNLAARRNHASFNEQDLQSFLLFLLNDFPNELDKIQSCAEDASSIEITQLKQAKPGSKIQSQKTTPDVEFWQEQPFSSITKEIPVIQILICELKAPSESTAAHWKPPMETEMFEGSLVSAEIKCTLLWQVFEAIFGTMMKANHEEKIMDKNHVVFQGGMLVCNDRVRSVVLAVNAESYRDIRQNKCARETFNWIANNPMWARLYIEARDHHILDALSRVIFTYNNFCNCVSLIPR